MPKYEPKWRSPFNTVKLPGITSEKFWYPDSYFYLVKAVTFDRNAQFMEISNDGTVSFNRKVSEHAKLQWLFLPQKLLTELKTIFWGRLKMHNASVKTFTKPKHGIRRSFWLSRVFRKLENQFVRLRK